MVYILVIIDKQKRLIHLTTDVVYVAYGGKMRMHNSLSEVFYNEQADNKNNGGGSLKYYHVSISPMKIAKEWGSLIAVYDEVPVTPPQHASTNEQATPGATTVPVVSDDDSGVAADAFGSQLTSTHTSLNSSSKPPRGINKRNANNNSHKNASFRSSASSNSATSSPEQSRRNKLLPTNSGGAFTRDMNRKSLSSNHPMLYTTSADAYTDTWVGQQRTYNTDAPNFYDEDEIAVESSSSTARNNDIDLDQRALKSVDVQPYTTHDLREIGLVVQSVVEGSYVDRVGELQTADRITHVNGTDLTTLSNANAKQIFDKAVTTCEVVKVRRTRSHHFLKDQVNILKSEIDSSSQQLTTTELLKNTKEPVKPSLPLVSEPKEAAIEAPSNTAPTTIEHQKSSKKHYFCIKLPKGKDGLGFSLTSKDVLTSNTREFFIKNILTRGAAISDGRLNAGDEVLKVNEIEVSNKSQSEVVKILRESKGIVTLHLARLKTSDEPPVSDEYPSAAADESSISLDNTADSTQSEQASEMLKIRVSLNGQGSAGLGISVKGRRSEDNTTDYGIYIQSIRKGGAAAKDGRLGTNDQLMCINDISLVNTSNSEAMDVLRQAMESSISEGAITLIVNRTQKSSLHSSLSSPDTSRSQRSNVSCASSMGKPFTESEQFDKLYLQPSNTSSSATGKPAHLYNINRNKSYFHAVAPQKLEDLSPTTPTDKAPTAVRKPKPIFPAEKSEPIVRKESVSKLPSYEEALKRRDTLSSQGSSPPQNESPLKTRFEKGGKFPISSENLFPITKYDTMKQEQRIQSAFVPLQRSRVYSISQNDLSSTVAAGRRYSRTASFASQSSLDSIMTGPRGIPFSRDAFGRSSMSERKGRAHIDATKSELYNKLKKFKSMEEIRASRIQSGEILLSPPELYSPLKKTESVDTVVSRLDAEEKSQFNRGTKLTSTYSPDNKARIVVNPLKTTMKKLKASKDVKMRETKHNKPRPYTCIIQDARARNSMLNDSLQEALNVRTTGDNDNGNNAQAVGTLDERKAKNKSILKNISTLLKRNKRTKDEQRSLSPEYRASFNTSDQYHTLQSVKRREKTEQRKRPLSLSVEDNKNNNDPFFFPQKDLRQEELVKQKMQEKKMQEKKMREKQKDEKLFASGSKNRKEPPQSDTRLKKSPKNERREKNSPQIERSPVVDRHLKPTTSGGNKSSPSEQKRQMDHAHDVEALRETARQFFPDGRDSTRSARSLQMNRQVSLPQQQLQKKTSEEQAHHVRYKSEDTKSTKNFANSMPNHRSVGGDTLERKRNTNFDSHFYQSNNSMGSSPGKSPAPLAISRTSRGSKTYITHQAEI